MTQITQRELPRAVERSVNEEMQAQFVRHQVYLQQLGTSEAVKIQALLSDLEGDVAKQLSKRFDAIQARGFDRGVNTTRRMQSLFVSFRKLNDQAIKTIQDQTAETLTELAVDEQDFVADTLKNTLPVRYDTRLVSPQYLRTIATKPLIEGTPLNTWWGKLADDTQIRLESAVRLSSAEGETVEQAIRRIRGTTQGGVFVDGALTGTRREAEALARTALNGTANQARMAVLEENDDLLKGYQWVATLDSRICLQCAGLDGKNYESMEGRIQPPAHVNCRCTLVPVLKSEEELGLPPVKGIKSTRASMNGQVPASQTYGRWLKDQPVSVQEDVLGKTKAKLFRDGKLKIGSFTNRKGKTLTLDELKVKEGRKKPKAKKPENALEQVQKTEAESARKAKIVADTNAPIEKRIEAWEEGDILVAQARGIKQKYAILEQKKEQMKSSLFSQIEDLQKEKIQVSEKLETIQEKLKKDGLSLDQRMAHPDVKPLMKRVGEIGDEIPKVAQKMMDVSSEYNLATNYGENIREEMMDLLAVRSKSKAKGTELPTVAQNLDVTVQRSSKLPMNEQYISREGREILDAVPKNEGMVNIRKVNYQVPEYEIEDNFKRQKANSANRSTEFFNRITRTETDHNIDIDMILQKEGEDVFRAHYDPDRQSIISSALDETSESTMVHEIGHSIEEERIRRGITSSFEFSKYRTKSRKYYSLADRFKGVGYRANEFGNDDKYAEINKARDKAGQDFNEARSAYFGKRYAKNKNKSKKTANWDIDEYANTEIVSILTEDLYDIHVDLADADPEAFKFIVGYLRGVF